MHKIKTVIIDADSKCLDRSSNLLHKFDDVEIVGTFKDPQKGMIFMLNNQPDLAFVQIEMPILSGLEIAEEISKQETNVKVILLSPYAHYAIKALKFNVFDYLLCPICIDELKDSLLRFNVKYKTDLNSRELQIIREMSNGLNSQNIGNKLSISKHTVDTYRRAILEKSNCQNTPQLIKFALKRGLI